MKVSAGNNLPIVDTPKAPAFAAGDVRAQENPDLTALQTLFVREHNYQVDRLHKEHPHWSGDKLYETAKAITTAEMVHITYNEFLPHLLVRPRHQRRGGKSEWQSPKFLVAKDARNRLALQPTRGESLQVIRFIRAERAVRGSDDAGEIEPERVADQHPRIEFG